MNFWKILKWTWFPLVLLIGIAYLYAPVTFLKGTAPEEIACISIFDGNTGEVSDITKAEDVAYILENLQSVPVRRTGISILEPGYRFRMTFTDESGAVVEELTINSTARPLRCKILRFGTKGIFLTVLLKELFSQIVQF